MLIGFLCMTVFSLGLSEDYVGPWRISLDDENACWTEGPSCKRVLTTSHGGDWNVEYPYDSMGAFENAYNNGADSVKGDFRVSKDNVGMVMHSSPIEIYESINCFNKKVEEMSAEECQQCEMINKDYNFVSVPDMLSWADGKVNVMYCVKESADIPRAITTLIENNATHRAFLEVHVNEYLDTIASNTPHWDEVYYVIEIKSPADIDTLLNNTACDDLCKKRSFLYEIQDSLNREKYPDLDNDIERVKQNGIRVMGVTPSNPVTATVRNHLELFQAGYDVAYTYNLGNAVEARMQVNGENGIEPV